MITLLVTGSAGYVASTVAFEITIECDMYVQIVHMHGLSCTYFCMNVVYMNTKVPILRTHVTHQPA